MSNAITAILVVLYGTFAIATTEDTAQQTQQIAAMSYTMQVCSQSHLVVSHFAEKACGDAQDKYKLEFLCDGTAAQAVCWVEAK